MTELSKFSQIHLDLLKEIGNIGAGNATTALSNLLNTPIHMNVPVVNIVSFDDAMNLAGGAEEVQAALLVEFEGEFSGNVFFLISPENADQFVQMLTQDPNQSLLSDDNDIAISAFLELGNILTGSYLRALSDFISANLYQLVPNAAIDMVGALISQGLIETSTVSDQVILIETVLSSDQLDDEIKGHFFLLPDPGAFHRIFELLGVQ
ncbi:chemotaxis protein CheC [Tenuibacillus multivorans]|uniref:Chemotaxis protein CheC n=1 Tax=Tenuibacillus multivorans TaxID=237069 RepID=A0A1G9XX96_9BACI|nr:chemotaxis protein CheC [Tenuibacillus multivorans]GEL75855.1 CheY-P phosphatase CheC [Tenuibacillus multivorans]SDN01397.1 chemotaxis protein CheC [Tenuibacillus multivorans]